MTDLTIPTAGYQPPPVAATLAADRDDRTRRWARADARARRLLATARAGSVGLTVVAATCVLAVGWFAVGSDAWAGHRQAQLADELVTAGPVDIAAIQAHAPTMPTTTTLPAGPSNPDASTAPTGPISAFATYTPAGAAGPAGMVIGPGPMPATDPGSPAAGSPVGPADPVTATESGTDNPTVGGGIPTAADGTPVAQIHFPSLGIAHTVVAGTSVPALRNGPGWMIGTAFAGEPGNTVISGHRTTYGGPFRHLDSLQEGDRIVVTSPGRPDATYEVRTLFTVDPTNVAVTTPTTGVRLTLTTCHPVGSDAERLVVQAELVEGTNAHLATPADAWMPMR